MAAGAKKKPKKSKKRTAGPAAKADAPVEAICPSAEVMAQLTEFESAVVTVLVSTVPGDVVSYGEVAAEAGYPGAARAVGNVLKRVDDLPWWRVVTAAGRLIPHHPVEQARRLAAEGVITSDGKVVIG